MDDEAVNFNPRTPCGVRRGLSELIYQIKKIFQSTHPLRGATHLYFLHDAHMGFQSTHPLRGATGTMSSMPGPLGFQSTHPLRGATALTANRDIAIVNFNPRTPCGVRR